jgi:hypothetical protein
MFTIAHLEMNGVCVCEKEMQEEKKTNHFNRGVDVK